jgi:hypothetical protein
VAGAAGEFEAMSIPKKKASKKSATIKFKFPDGTFEEMPVASYEEQLLSQAIRAMHNADWRISQWGQDYSKKVTERLAKAVIQNEKLSNTRMLAAAKRKNIGAAKGKRVLETIATGKDPTQIASERTVRRIKAKHK